MVDANITAPAQPGDTAAEEAANAHWATATPAEQGDQVDRALDAWADVFGRAPRVDAPRTDDLHEIPEAGDGLLDD